MFLACLWLQLLFSLVPTSFGRSGSTSSEIVVDLGYAKYQGLHSYPNTVAYLGIPYAEPPVGDRRFRAPAPLNTSRITEQAHGKIVDATVYPNVCIQGTTGGSDAGGAGSEDCLKVNVYTPHGLDGKAKLPVLVYIHGGGYRYGNPAAFPFDLWVQQSPNVVVVSVYYRLDSFGFLSVPELNDSVNGDLNAGFLDQTQALRWVQSYIHAFGGDPNHVTINGQSAGGSSVLLHLVAPQEEKLFSAAIAQSIYRTPVPTPEQTKPLFQYYAGQAGCGDGSVPTQISCLRNASTSSLALAQDAAFDASINGGYNLFHPVVDNKVIVDYPTKLISEGKFAQVPLIVGSTSNESLTGGPNLTSALQLFFPSLTSVDLQEFVEVYPESDFASEEQWSLVSTGEPSVICGRNALGGAFSKVAPTWTYRYNQPNPTSGDPSVTAHAAENWMMFNGTNTSPNATFAFTPLKPVELAFSEELIAYWLSFVRTYSPNTYKLARSPTWPSYSSSHKARTVLQQDSKNDTSQSGIYIEEEPEAESKRCAFVVSKTDDEED